MIQKHSLSLYLSLDQCGKNSLQLFRIFQIHMSGKSHRVLRSFEVILIISYIDQYRYHFNR